MRWWRHGVCVEQRHAHLSGCGDPAQSKSASPRDPMPDLLGNSRYFLQISNAYYRVCFIGGNMLVSVFFFFLSKFMKLVPFSTLLSYNCLLAYHVSGSINGFLAPCWHWYRCCDKALLLAPLTFLSALTLLSKFFFLLKPILRSFVR